MRPMGHTRMIRVDSYRSIAMREPPTASAVAIGMYDKQKEIHR